MPVILVVRPFEIVKNVDTGVREVLVPGRNQNKTVLDTFAKHTKIKPKDDITVKN